MSFSFEDDSISSSPGSLHSGEMATLFHTACSPAAVDPGQAFMKRSGNDSSISITDAWMTHSTPGAVCSGGSRTLCFDFCVPAPFEPSDACPSQSSRSSSMRSSSSYTNTHRTSLSCQCGSIYSAHRLKLSQLSDDMSPSLSSSTDESGLSNESSPAAWTKPMSPVMSALDYALHLAATDPRLSELDLEDYIDASEILIASDDVNDEESYILGEGAQGLICKANLAHNSGTSFAVKIGASKVILHEYILTKRFSHPHIIKSFGFSIIRRDQVEATVESMSPTTPATQWIYMALYEYCENGDLLTFFKRNPEKLHEPKFLRSIVDPVLDALAHMHHTGYVHCDIKPENVLLDKDLQPRISDFGHTQRISNRMVAQGTPSYLAPEVVSAWKRAKAPHTFTDRLDIFSLGAMSAYILTGDFPFERITAKLLSPETLSQEQLEAIFDASRLPLDSLAAKHQKYADFLKLCLNPLPEKRASALELLEFLRRDNNSA